MSQVVALRVSPQRRSALRAGLSALVAVLAIGVASVAPAEGETWGYQLSHELMSPFCPGRTLASCPSEKADELRIWILMQENAGATRDDVISQLVARYGEVVLPAPPPDDATGIIGYAVPIVAIVLGGPLVWWLLRRLTARGGSAPPVRSAPAAAAGAPVDDELAAEVDRELRELDA